MSDDFQVEPDIEEAAAAAGVDALMVGAREPNPTDSPNWLTGLKPDKTTIVRISGQTEPGRGPVFQFTTAFKLGEGGLGVAYSAFAGALTDRQVRERLQRGEPPTHVLKVQKTNTGLTKEELRAFALREYAATRAIADITERQSGAKPCDTEDVCAVRYFITPNAQIVVVFNYENGVDAFDYAEEVAAMFTDNGALKLAHELLTVSIALADAVYAINRLGIYHRDIKPENLLVLRGATKPLVKGAKLLDFGFAEALLAPGFEKIVRSKEGQEALALITLRPQADGRYVYSHGTTPFRDPLSGIGDWFEPVARQFHFTRDEARETFPKFETFAVALCIVDLFDVTRDSPMQPASRNRNYTVRQTYLTRYVPGLLNVLLEMTGPLNKRRRLDAYATDLRIMQAGLKDASVNRLPRDATTPNDQAPGVWTLPAGVAPRPAPTPTLRVTAKLLSKPMENEYAIKTSLSLPPPRVQLAINMAGALHAVMLMQFAATRRASDADDVTETLNIELNRTLRFALALEPNLYVGVRAFFAALGAAVRPFAKQQPKAAALFAAALAPATSIERMRVVLRYNYQGRFDALIDALYAIAFPNVKVTNKPMAPPPPPPLPTFAASDAGGQFERTPLAYNNVVNVFRFALIGLAAHLTGDARAAYVHYTRAQSLAFEFNG